MNFIQEHPGGSKSDVVRMMEDQHEASRMTVLNKLDRLEAEEYIIARTDKPNSQIYKLFVNENNLLVTEIHQLATFRKALSALINVIDTKKEEIDSLWRKLPRDRGYTDKLKPQDLILSIYSTLNSIYSAKSILEWPNKINDEQVLTKLYETVFRQLFDIQKIILVGFPVTLLTSPNLRDELRQSRIVDTLLNSHYLLRPYSLDTFVYVFERFKLLDAVTPVIDSLWKLSSPFFVPIKLYIKSREKRDPELWVEMEKEETFNNWKVFLKAWRIVREKVGPI